MSSGSRIVAPVGVVDVGGGHVTAGVVVDGRLVDERRTALDPHARRDDLLARLTGPASEAARASFSAGRPAPTRWVVALPGPFDYDAGRGSFEGVDKFAALSGVDLRASFAEALGTSPASVRFVNDAVAYAVGEWSSGAGARADRMICLTLGTGVGSAFLVDGRPVTDGAGVPLDGNVHTLTVDGGPLEETVSTPALRSGYRRRTGDDLTVERICDLARAGDAVAISLVTDTFTALGTALQPCVELFEAGTVVVGGGVSRSWDVIGAPFAAGLVQGVPGPVTGLTVVPGTLGDHAPLIGAASWAEQG
ncbi:ROK family protein [Frigoribacterium sp. 2355]